MRIAREKRLAIDERPRDEPEVADRVTTSDSLEAARIVSRAPRSACISAPCTSMRMTDGTMPSSRHTASMVTTSTSRVTAGASVSTAETRLFTYGIALASY